YGMRYPQKVKGWAIDETSTYFEHRPGDRGWDLSRWPIILNTINLKAIPASALAIGALTYQKHLGENEDTRRWLEQAIFSISTFRDIYAPDGSYNEGVSYANYTSLHLVQAIVGLKRRLGVDLTDLLNWSGYSTYLAEMTIPTHDDHAAIVNFSDADGGATSAVPFWIAAQTFDSHAQWFGKTLARAHDEWSLLWYNPTRPALPPSRTARLWKSDLDWIVGRGGYGPNDLVVAMRSGGPHNHEHADRNSIIVKCFGEQLVTDPNRPPYTFTDPSWIMRTTAGHSAVLIDGKGHQYVDGSEGTNSSDAVANIVRSGERDRYFFWSSDATPAYKLVLPDVASITRSVVVLYDFPAVLLFDKVQKIGEPSKIQARFFGYNKDGKGSLSVDESTFLMKRPAAQLQGSCFAGGGISIAARKLPIPDEKAALYPFVEVSTNTARTESFLITALLPNRVSGSEVSAEIRSQEAGQYLISLRSGRKQATCQVFDTGELPEFNISF
ncbi:heparinase II/III-family protein, partial [bacterium]|nr:heparinase II/III-family protein [bacterium]